MRDDHENSTMRDGVDDPRGDAQRVRDTPNRADDEAGATRRFKRRIDCSPRTDSPSWSDERFR
jgi:hypothetical protein